ncbi:MAG: SelB C-terminal domain-containing protein, partial [Desulfovibrionaceae bacterium]|nr:SelB C-terminal domain-containing protein [Desulfovibrionaceae bacterium]
CSLLGVETGLVALTKVDLVEPDWLDMVSDDVAGYLGSTFLADAPVIPVSAHTGQGLERLKEELAKAVAAVRPKRRNDLFRLPVDRVFVMKGYGTVVTGTMISGDLSVGQEVRVYPGSLTARVRSLQSHGQAVERAESGSRTAVNLQGLEVADLARGDVLARPGTLFPSQAWEVELTCLKSSPRSIKHRKELHFHHGSREVMARVFLLDREALAPGETAVCQVRFQEPLAGVYGDRVVLRSFSPLRTVAGGRLVSPLARKVKRFSPQAERLWTLARGGPREVVALQLERAGTAGLDLALMSTMTELEVRDLDALLKDMCARQEAILYDRDQGLYVSAVVAAELSRGLLEHLTAFHAKEPMKAGLPRAQLASGWGRDLAPRLFHRILERLVKSGEAVMDQDALRLPGHKASLASDQVGLRRSLLEAYESAGTAPPNLKDVLAPLGLEPKEAAAVLGMLVDQGRLVKVKEGMYFSVRAMDEIRDKVVFFLARNQDMEPSDFRDLTGLSRKYAIPLMEHLDKEKLTVRVGDRRRLRKR